MSIRFLNIINSTFPNVLHFSQTKGAALADVGVEINDLDRVPPVELGEGYRDPYGIREWLLGKDGVLLGEERA